MELLTNRPAGVFTSRIFWSARTGPAGALAPEVPSSSPRWQWPGDPGVVSKNDNGRASYPTIACLIQRHDVLICQSVPSFGRFATFNDDFANSMTCLSVHFGSPRTPLALSSRHGVIESLLARFTGHFRRSPGHIRTTESPWRDSEPYADICRRFGRRPIRLHCGQSSSRKRSSCFSKTLGHTESRVENPSCDSLK